MRDIVFQVFFPGRDITVFFIEFQQVSLGGNPDGNVSELFPNEGVYFIHQPVPEAGTPEIRVTGYTADRNLGIGNALREDARRSNGFSLVAAPDDMKRFQVFPVELGIRTVLFHNENADPQLQQVVKFPCTELVKSFDLKMIHKQSSLRDLER